MAIDPVRFAVDQIIRILESMQWSTVIVSTEGPVVRITIEKAKEKILKP